MKRLVSILTTAAMLLSVAIAPISTSAASAKKPSKVSLKSVRTISTTTVKVTWKSVDQAKGYQIKISANKKFTKAKTINTTKTSNKTIKRLKSGTRYYVKVRVYKNVNGNKKYGKWSNIKSAKTKAVKRIKAKAKPAVSRTTQTRSTTAAEYSITYVLNPKSMIVHKQGCRTLKYEYLYPTTNDLQGALNQGYSMCKICWR